MGLVWAELSKGADKRPHLSSVLNGGNVVELGDRGSSGDAACGREQRIEVALDTRLNSLNAPRQKLDVEP